MIQTNKKTDGIMENRNVIRDISNYRMQGVRGRKINIKLWKGKIQANPGKTLSLIYYI